MACTAKSVTETSLDTRIERPVVEPLGSVSPAEFELLVEAEADLIESLQSVFGAPRDGIFRPVTAPGRLRLRAPWVSPVRFSSLSYGYAVAQRSDVV